MAAWSSSSDGSGQAVAVYELIQFKLIFIWFCVDSIFANLTHGSPIVTGMVGWLAGYRLSYAERRIRLPFSSHFTNMYLFLILLFILLFCTIKPSTRLTLSFSLCPLFCPKQSNAFAFGLGGVQGVVALQQQRYDTILLTQFGSACELDFRILSICHHNFGPNLFSSFCFAQLVYAPAQLVYGV